jgi:chemosensory pili system protein ChpC
MSTSPQGTAGDSTLLQDIRGVLIQIAGARLLLPNATISEVLSYADPEPVDNAPAWLLGRIRWRGWQLPLVSFARIAGLAEEQGGLGSKVVVLKALGGDANLPHFAMLTQGFPRLVTVSRDGLAMEDDDGLPVGMRACVTLNEERAYVPDLGAIEELIVGAGAQAA